MRHTKIVCTLGPSSDSRTEIQRLAQAGMDVARLNFSHGTPESHGKAIENIRKVEESVGRTIGILQDLPGPKIRIGTIRGGAVQLTRGKLVEMVSEEMQGTEDRISLPHPEILEQLRPGHEVFLADGLIHLRVTERTQDGVMTRVLNGGSIGSHKGVNLPDVDLPQGPSLARDLEMMEFGLEAGVDWVAVSFVGDARDAEPYREVLRRRNSPVLLLAKIERKRALRNIDQILEAFDGLLVARGDLGIETPIRDVPVVQKQLVKKANCAGKPVVVATQMLMSMVNNPRPTRAEATDVANAILDGTDAVMLSEETAVGRYPARCVATMSRIAVSAEGHMFKGRDGVKRLRGSSPGSAIDSIALGAATLAQDVKAQALLTCTSSGTTARAVSKYRPNAPILAAVSEQCACGQLALSWGVVPFAVQPPEGINDLILQAVEGAKESKMVRQGDWVVLVAGVRAGVPGNTSLIKYHRIGDVIWE